MFLWLVRVFFLVCLIGWSFWWVHAMFVQLVVEVDFVFELVVEELIEAYQFFMLLGRFGLWIVV